MIQTVDTGVTRHIARYSDAVRIPADHDLVILSGTPGLTEDGTTPPDFIDEARRAWTNVRRAPADAGAELTDIVSVRTWLTSSPVSCRTGTGARTERARLFVMTTDVQWSELQRDPTSVATLTDKGDVRMCGSDGPSLLLTREARADSNAQGAVLAAELGNWSMLDRLILEWHDTASIRN